MKPERWQQLDRLFHAALERALEQRAAFLDEACAGDESLRKQVEALLAAHEEAGSFIESPAMEVAARSAADNHKELSAGHTIGHYRIVSQLGVGGMGEVYLAEDATLGRNVALKLLPSEFTHETDRLRRFQQEARAASALNHPNIVTIHEIGQIDNTHFIATEFIDGRTLREFLAAVQAGSTADGSSISGKLPELLNITIQTVDALGAAHEAGIVHRDIKPENIMVRRRDGYVKVLDFGLAKLAEGAVDTEAPTRAHIRTSAGVVMGTPGYMSPEQARGEPVDARTDIWSVGVVLYELVAGRAPFGRATPTEVIALILEREPPPLARYAREVPPELERIVTKALTKDRNDRYQTARDLLVDLRRLRQQMELEAQIERSAQTLGSRAGAPTNGGSVSPEAAAASTAHSRPSSPDGVKNNNWFRRGILIGLATCVTVLLATAAYFAYSRNANARRTGTLRTLAVLPFENKTNDGESKYLCEGIPENLINSLSLLPGVTVRARNSSFKYDGADPQKAARDLNVDAVLTGRVSRLGDHLVISVELVNARDNIQEWGERYDRKQDDVFRLQSEISREIAEHLSLQLAAGTKRQLERASAVSPQAYDLLMRGRYLWRSAKAEDQQRAIENFKEAIATDPSYALAYAELGSRYQILIFNGILDPKEFRPKAEAAVKRALELDENLAVAHYALANLRKDDWDWAVAEREYQRALELDPNLVGAHTSYYHYLVTQQRFDEAITQAKRASELDPLSIFPLVNVGVSLAVARRYTEAIESFKKTVELDPRAASPHLGLGYIYTAQGKYGEALTEYEEMNRLGGTDLSLQIYLGAAYARSGERDKAAAISKLLETTKEYVSPAELSVLYIALGDHEQAFRLLDKAYAAHDLQLGNIGADASYDDIRDDPRFKNLLRRVGLPA